MSVNAINKHVAPSAVTVSTNPAKSSSNEALPKMLKGEKPLKPEVQQASKEYITAIKQYLKKNGMGNKYDISVRSLPDTIDRYHNYLVINPKNEDLTLGDVKKDFKLEHGTLAAHNDLRAYSEMDNYGEVPLSGVYVDQKGKTEQGVRVPLDDVLHNYSKWDLKEPSVSKEAKAIIESRDALSEASRKPGAQLMAEA